MISAAHNLGEYLPHRKIWEKEGLDGEGLKASMNYVLRCAALGWSLSFARGWSSNESEGGLETGALSSLTPVARSPPGRTQDPARLLP
eukprot:1390136-Amphidinium_carterae.1